MTPSREAIEAARATRRRKFERTHILKSYDPTIDPTENELDDAEAALTAAYARDFPQPSKSDEEVWRDLCEKDDRTSPAEYPDMALITFDELAAIREQTLDECEAIAERLRVEWRSECGEKIANAIAALKRKGEEK